MIPRRFNPRQMSQLMRQLGINVKEIENVERVIIQTKDKEYIFKDAEVTIMEAQGQKTYQIVGRPEIKEIKEIKKIKEIKEKEEEGEKEEGIPKEDIELVMEKTGKTEEEARKALEESNGDIAEAILKLSGK